MGFLVEGLALQEVGQLPASVSNRLLTQAHDLRDLLGAAPAQAMGLNGRIKPALFIVQGGKEESQFPVVLCIRMVGPAEAVRATAGGWLWCGHGRPSERTGSSSAEERVAEGEPRSVTRRGGRRRQSPIRRFLQCSTGPHCAWRRGSPGGYRKSWACVSRRLLTGRRQLADLLEGKSLDKRPDPVGGRPRTEEKFPAVTAALQEILSDEVGGDPMGERTWVRNSVRKLAGRLRDKGFPLSSNTGALAHPQAHGLLDEDRRQEVPRPYP